MPARLELCLIGRDMFSLVRGRSTNSIICMSESSSDYDDSISHMMTANDKVFNYTLTVGWWCWTWNDRKEDGGYKSCQYSFSKRSVNKQDESIKVKSQFPSEFSSSHDVQHPVHPPRPKFNTLDINSIYSFDVYKRDKTHCRLETLDYKPV